MYAEACELLREVMLRSADDESIKKYAALSSSYLNRIDELQDYMTCWMTIGTSQTKDADDSCWL